MAKIISMRTPSARLILWSRRARKQTSAAEPNSMARSMISKLSGAIEPEIATGKASTIQILKMLLPTILPTKRSDSLRLAAVMVVTSSGNDVPRATTVNEIMRSETPMAVAMAVAELTTSWLPATTPAKPTITNRKDLPSLYSGFSTVLASFLFLRASANR